eukprot:362673-Chlamydomonas_euryale.AAC.3
MAYPRCVRSRGGAGCHAKLGCGSGCHPRLERQAGRHPGLDRSAGCHPRLNCWAGRHLWLDGWAACCPHYRRGWRHTGGTCRCSWKGF